MPTILLKKSDTPGSVPGTANLTNLAGGVEVAVNTADKRVYSMTSASAVIELGTNPSSLTCSDVSATVLRSASATITNLIATSASITTLTNNPTFSAGTANGVLYLNGSKVATSGSALVFDGTNLGVNCTATALTNYRGSEFAGTTATTGGFLRMRTSDSSINSLDFTDSNGRAIFTTTNHPIRFGTNDVERMRLTSSVLSTDSSISVGIGTASPASKLHVAGNVRAVNANARYDLIGTSQQWGLQVVDADGRLRFINETSGTGSELVLTTSGNLGLGVTPNAWSLKALQVGQSGFLGTATDTNISANAYYNSGWKYAANGGASLFNQSGSVSSWYVGANNTSGANATWTLGSAAMTLDASGNLGVGTSTPTLYGGYKTIALAGGATGGVIDISPSGGISTGGCQLSASASSTAIDALGPSGGSAAFLAFRTGTSGAVAERARITSGGDFEIGTQAGTGTRTLTIQTNTSGDPTLILSAAGADSGQFWYDRANTRLYARSSNTGGVYLASGGTSWTAVSDERKKDIIEPITNAAEKVASLRAVVGKYKTDQDGVRRSFLIAQDVQAVFPEAIDASDENELGLSYTDTIPLLVAAIKELKAELDAAKVKIAALEAK